MMKSLFESKFAVLSYNSQQQYMCLQVRGFMKENDFREVLLKARKLFPTLGVHKMLNDFREFKGTTPAMQEWVVKEYYPSLVKDGLTHGALVLSNDVFAKFAAKNVQNKVHNFDYPAFPDLQEAENWLAKH